MNFPAEPTFLVQSPSNADGEQEVSIDMITLDMDKDSVPSTDSDSDRCSTTRTTEDSHKEEESEKPVCRKIVSLFKHVYSCALLIFCIVVVGAAIFEKQTIATGEKSLSPTAAFVIFWVLLLYLALLEGGLNVMVGLKPVDPALYAHSHPLAFGCTALAHKGENLDRFIVGRQYLDLTMVFTTSFMVSAIDGATVLGLPQTVSNIFLESGLAVTLVTIVIGQLVAQINSTQCMLDFVNNYVMLGSTYLALFVEASGILHSVYFIQIVVSKLSGGTKSQEEQEKKTPFQKTTFWLRVAFSVSLLTFSIVVTVKALFEGTTTMWDSVPAYASLIILAALILIAGIMESLQIAFLAVVHMPEDKLNHHPTAKRNCDFIFGRKNRLQAFLVGRQICQTVIMFVIARIISLDVQSGDNIFGVSDGFQRFLNSGVLGTLFATIIASLSWRVLANTFPMAFLDNFLSRPIIYLCLITEATGVCSIAWWMAKIHRRLARFKKDGYYLVDGCSSDKSLDSTERAMVFGTDEDVVVLHEEV